MDVVTASQPITVPGPPGLLHTLLVATFFLHVLFLNMVMGGSVFSAGAWLAGGHGKRLAREVSSWNIRTFALAALTGFMPFLSIQVLYGRLFHEGILLLGSFWVMVLAALLLGLGTGTLQAYARPSSPPWVLLAAASLVLTGLALSIFTVVAQRPDLWARIAVDSGAVFQAPSLVPRFLHFLVGAVAFAGFMIMYVHVRSFRPDAPEEDRDYHAWAAGCGLRWARWMTALELGVGVWFLVSLPRDVLLDVIGKQTYAVATLGAGMLLAIVLVISFFGIQDPVRERTKSTSVLVIFLLTILDMVLLRDAVRGLYLRETLAEAVFIVEPRWLLVALFAALLVATLLLARWSLVRKAGASLRRGPE